MVNKNIYFYGYIWEKMVAAAVSIQRKEKD